VIVTDKWREPKSGRKYEITNKEPERDHHGQPYKLDMLYWQFVEKIRDILGEEPSTLMDIYQHVTRPNGLSTDDTKELVKGAVNHGFLK
jgi:deoxyribodipyrimidine photolyase-like uncharacterized protein